MQNARPIVTLALLVGLGGCSGADRPPGAGDVDAGAFDATASDTSGFVDTGVPADSALSDAGTSDVVTDSTTSDADAAMSDAVPPGDGSPLSEASLADSFGDDSEPGDVKPPPGPSCLPTTTTAKTLASTLASPGDDVFAAITPDEKTIVFYRVGSGGAVTVLTADRPNVKASFPSPVAATVPPTGFAASRMTISPDGLRLVFVSADGRSIRQIVRTSRSNAFDGSADATPFAIVNKLAADGSSLLGYPVLGSDDLTMYFTYGDPLVAPAIRRATRATTSDAWSATAPVEGTAIAGTGTMGMVPTGISPDARTMFVWTPSGGHEYAVYRDSPTALFTDRVDLGTRRNASPSGDCLSLYYCAPTTSAGLDMFVDE